MLLCVDESRASAGSSSGLEKPLFIDVFAGCGGLSVGLLKAGWQGSFAIERDRFAFETYRHNLIDGRMRPHFRWPAWLSCEPHCINEFMQKNVESLKSLRGKITLLAGGPPCQGFSSAGRRDPADPRNELLASYLDLIDTLQPTFVMIENVKGFAVDFPADGGARESVNYAEKLTDRLSVEYDVVRMSVNTSDFGVPQRRVRYIFIGSKKGCGLSSSSIAQEIENQRLRFISENKFAAQSTARMALSDLEVTRNGTIACRDSAGFSEISYLHPLTELQAKLRDDYTGAPSDTRLAKHRPEIVARFQDIIQRCQSANRLNVSIGAALREKYQLKKRAIRVMDPDRPAPTITSMPDDLLHYAEPRTLTVRENARLQSFPDWFEFRGKYTTGGHLRRLEVPRFTQVANAVPPFVAEVFGRALLVLNEQVVQRQVATSKAIPD